MRTGQRLFSRSAGAIAAALIAAAVAFVPSSPSLAQYDQKKQRAQKFVPQKGQVQQPRRNAMPGGGMMRNRNTPGQAFGPNNNFRAPNAPRGNAAVPNAGPGGFRGANTTPNARPNTVRGPNTTPNTFRAQNTTPGSRFGGNQSGNRLRTYSFGNRSGTARFGNRTGAFGNRFGFANRQGAFGRFSMRRAVNGATPQLRQTQRFDHRREMFAVRARMPAFPLPGERNFTGVPPVSETRYVSAEMVCQWDPTITRERIDEIARQHNLTVLSVQRSALAGTTLVHFAIGGNRTARDVVRAMEAERIVSQPNYVYYLGQQTETETAAAKSAQSAPDHQYVASKLRLAEVHKIATGKDVVVAVIDSEIDQSHPELSKGITERFDAVGKPDRPHMHGTGMAGAIVAQDRLMGVAPGARMLAVHAFSTGAIQQSPQATTQSIIAGLDWALAKGARIINMSFAGPHDPILSLHMKKAADKGAILIAAVGNAGPKSPPLYPAADPRVIGVTAIDEKDQLYKGANIGAQVALAAPGVDVMVPAPASAYQLTTGTSVAAAHVSGVVALLLEKHPEADAQLILEVLTASAARIGNKRDDNVGWGLIDPLAALNELDARMADNKVASAPAAPATEARAPSATARQAAAPTRAAAPAAAGTRSALPRPGIYVPKQ